MRRSQTNPVRNRLLAALSARETALIDDELEPIDLPLRFRLETTQRRVKHAYFLDSGIASVVASGAHKSNIEVGIIGFEGCTGLSVLLGADRAPHDVYMQAAGAGWRIKSSVLQKAADRSASLRQVLLKFCHVFAVQTAYTALANGRCTIEERLARWLLMAQDRLQTDVLPMTHEFLALMLGVRRPGVTLALRTLEQHEFIGGERGVVNILDRDGLKKCCNGAYGAPEAELKRLFG